MYLFTHSSDGNHKMKFKSALFYIALGLLCNPFSINNAFGEIDPDTALDEQIESVKKDVLNINRELFILEEELLFPGSTQASFFVSMDTGTFFELQGVELKYKNKTVASHLYTPGELQALKKGGIQKLHIGNVAEGDQTFVAIFVGVGPNGRDFKRGADIIFEKTDDPIFLEIKITDDESKERPSFTIEEWEL